MTNAPKRSGARSKRLTQRQAQERRRAERTDEESRVERDAAAAAQRKRRGVTAYYKALELPVGQREDQLLSLTLVF